ncbi:sulfatase-like hydrolase/transferase [Stenotrophomonas maltophilia]|uniref:sulfatase-like hydrolase/transferase n=1 Tax=Stenotrophomonas maltophilia TaxID=40324 RepID=UPI00137934E9|nr:sulfatase-like hydrolase/transferase [Stenotrophomonas maltophilia]
MSRVSSAAVPARSSGWMPTFAAALMLATLVPTLINLEWPQAWDARLFVAVAAVGHLGLAALLCCLPGWFCLAVAPLRRAAGPLTVMMASAWLALVLVDARVYQLFGFHLNALVLALLLQGGLLQQLGMTSEAYAAAAAGIGVVVALAGGLLRGLSSEWARPWLLRPRWLLGLLPMVLLTQGMAIWHDARKRSDALASLQAVPWLPTATARRTMEKWGLATTAGAMLQPGPVAEHGSALSYPRTALRCQADAPMSILMLVVDSLRHDMLTPAQMPNVSRFATQAWQAQQHYSTGNNTMHGMFGLFYGLPALHTNTMIHHRRGPELLRQLDARGYQFHLYGGASLQGARMDRAVFVESDAVLRTAPDDVQQDRRDRHVIDRLRNDLRLQDPQRPFLGFALLDSAHTPYAVPAEAERRFLPQSTSGDHLKVGRHMDPMPLFNRYRNAVLKADVLIGDVLQTLQESGLAERTVVIVTSDHGESFNDLGQNDWGHNSNFSDHQLRVPMLIRWPGHAPALETAVTSHMDLAPTLLRHLLGCDNDVGDHSAGLDLYSRLPPQRPLLVESWTSRAVRVGTSTLLLKPYGIEARDTDYRRVDASPVLDPQVHAGIISQMQLPR